MKLVLNYLNRIHWVVKWIVSCTDYKETHGGVYKYALDSIQIEEEIEAQCYHFIQTRVCILWHTFWSECPMCIVALTLGSAMAHTLWVECSGTPWAECYSVHILECVLQCTHSGVSETVHPHQGECCSALTPDWVGRRLGLTWLNLYTLQISFECCQRE